METIEEENTINDLYLIFSVEDRNYALELVYLIEIISFQKITPVDNLPYYVKGVINLRGKIIPVIDVRARLKMKESTYNEFTVILIINIGKIIVGLIVDAVQEIIHIEKKDIEPTPEFGICNEAWCIDYLCKVGDGIKMIVNLDKFLHHKENQELFNI